MKIILFFCSIWSFVHSKDYGFSSVYRDIGFMEEKATEIFELVFLPDIRQNWPPTRDIDSVKLSAHSKQGNVDLFARDYYNILCRAMTMNNPEHCVMNNGTLPKKNGFFVQLDCRDGNGSCTHVGVNLGANDLQTVKVILKTSVYSGYGFSSVYRDIGFMEEKAKEVFELVFSPDIRQNWPPTRDIDSVTLYAHCKQGNVDLIAREYFRILCRAQTTNNPEHCVMNNGTLPTKNGFFVELDCRDGNGNCTHVGVNLGANDLQTVKVILEPKKHS